MELQELINTGTRWYATVIEDLVPGSRPTEFPGYVSREAVIAGLKLEFPRMLVLGSAMGIPIERRTTYLESFGRSLRGVPYHP